MTADYTIRRANDEFVVVLAEYQLIHHEYIFFGACVHIIMPLPCLHSVGIRNSYISSESMATYLKCGSIFNNRLLQIFFLKCNNANLNRSKFGKEFGVSRSRV